MRLLILLILLTSATQVFSKQKHILMMVSEGFYAPEYYTPLKAFTKAGFKVSTATKYLRATRPDERQLAKYMPVMPNLTFNQIKPADYDAIVFAGGNGAWEDFFPNSDVHKVLEQFLKSGKITALLCSSTGLLAVANNLSGANKPIAYGRKVTGYKRVKGLLTKLGGVKYLAGQKGKPFVVVDKNLITGRDPLSTKLFAQIIIRKLR